MFLAYDPGQNVKMLQFNTAFVKEKRSHAMIVSKYFVFLLIGNAELSLN